MNLYLEKLSTERISSIEPYIFVLKKLTNYNITSYNTILKLHILQYNSMSH